MYCSSENRPEAVFPKERVPGIPSDGKDSSDVGVMLQYNTIQLDFITSIHVEKNYKIEILKKYGVLRSISYR